ncbi:uncharacterized protein [Primulina huaijiensis]|uniref:uncharacterized protein isoform X3 n=1 Tax=Primulina huaijiensis TaxID=1492673 RepID=UPI003CC7192E
MEIDFMGLYSQNPAPGAVQNSYEPDEFVDSGIGSGEGNVSLSLCTSSPMEEKAVFRDFPRKKIGKSPAENMTMMRNSACNYDWVNAQPRERSCQSFVGKQVIGHSGFLYNRDDSLPISRLIEKCMLLGMHLSMIPESPKVIPQQWLWPGKQHWPDSWRSGLTD